MSRDFKVYLEDILASIRKIRTYVGKASRDGFFKDEKSVDAVLRNLEIIGEAAKKVPDSVRLAQPDVEWKRIAGLRDILSHEYFNVNADIIWDVIQNKLAPLETEVKAIIKERKPKRWTLAEINREIRLARKARKP